MKAHVLRMLFGSFYSNYTQYLHMWQIASRFMWHWQHALQCIVCTWISGWVSV